MWYRQENALGYGPDPCAATVVAAEQKTYTKSKSNWATLNAQSALPLAAPGSGSASPSVKREPDDPDADGSGDSAPPPPKKRKGGLMSAADIAAEQAALRAAREEAERARRIEAGEDPDADGGETSAAGARSSGGREQETVYRSAAGQKIDVKAELAERARLAAEEARKEAERAEWGKGLVQRREREERVRRERDATTQGVARWVSVGAGQWRSQLMDMAWWQVRGRRADEPRDARGRAGRRSRCGVPDCKSPGIAFPAHR